MQLADKLLGAMKSEEENEIQYAIGEAKNYNLISKSVKTLPANGKSIQQPRQPVKFGKLVGPDAQDPTGEQIQMVEKKRDEHIASRLQQINDKQNARIREIGEREKKDRQAQQKKVDQLTFQNPILNEELNKDINNVSGANNGSNLFAVNPVTQRESLPLPSELDRSNENSKMFYSARKEYFNSKTSHTQADLLPSSKKGLAHSRNDSSSNLKPRHGGLDPINASELHNLVTHNMTNQTVNQTNNQSVWNPSSKIAKQRADVSFLQEKSLQLYAANANRKIPMDGAHGLLMSQSQLTSGDQGRDDYLQVALGLRQIGKSIMDMPKSIDELRVLSNEYKKNLGANDEIHEEQIYLQYIEDHLKAQEKYVRKGIVEDVEADRLVSPIRNLIEFYNKKMNRFDLRQHDLTMNSTLNKSKMRVAGQKTMTQTYVNIEGMTSQEIAQLEKDPPVIKTARKNVKIIDQKAMEQFGDNAFRLKKQSQPNLLTTTDHKHSLSPGKYASQKKRTEISLSPKRERTQNQSAAPITPRDMMGGNKSTMNKKGGRYVDKNALLKSLNDQADQLTNPSIVHKLEAETLPKWLKLADKGDDVSTSNLGKPSSRQDAVLLAKWFKDIMEMIEAESQSTKNQAASQQKLFPNQKQHEGEMIQSDIYLLTQVAHNIAIKEVTRQVSVQCVERGVLLKSIFDSYVRLIDFIFQDSFHQRRMMAKAFAKATQKQVELNDAAIALKQQLIQNKNEDIENLKLQLSYEKQTQHGLNITNKKLSKMANKYQSMFEDEQKISMQLGRQCKYLQSRLLRMQEQIDPSKVDVLLKEVKRNMTKIEQQADIDHKAQISKVKLLERTREGTSAEDKLMQGEIIRDAEKATDMDEYGKYLEMVNGGPLKADAKEQTELEMCDQECGTFDLYEVGLLKDAETEIEKEWRLDTRPKRLRKAVSEQKYVKSALESEESWYETSSHASIDYRVPPFAKTFQAGDFGGYRHIKRPHRQKCSISAGNFNFNLLVNEREEKEDDLNLNTSHGAPLSKLRRIIGEEKLEMIRIEKPELYATLMEYINSNKTITESLCRELLAEYDLTFNVEADVAFHKKLREKAQREYGFDGDDGDDSYFRNSNSVSRGGGENKMNKTSNSAGDLGGEYAASGKATGNKRDLSHQHKKKNNMFQFVEWNFQKRAALGGPKARNRKDHPSFPIMIKILEKNQKNKEIKELMPMKTLTRYIYQVYMAKAAEIQADKLGKKLGSTPNVNQNRSISPIAEEMDKGNLYLKNVSKNQAQSGENSPKAVKKKSRSPGDGKERGKSEEKDGSFRRTVSDKDNKSRANSDNMETAKNQSKVLPLNLTEWVYEFLHTRYGMQTMANKKFSQIIGSCLKYKDKNPRFRLFGRFLQLYEPLGDQDLKLYIDVVHNMFKTVLNFQIQETDDVIYIPSPRAIDFFRLTFSSRLTNASLNHCLKIIRRKQLPITKVLQDKFLHLHTYTETVQLDDFSEFVIHTTNQLQNEKLQNIEDIFAAADLNQNGVLELAEIKTLYKVLGSQHQGDVQAQQHEARRLFEEYAEIHPKIKNQLNLPVKGIGPKTFERLCLERDVFTIRQQNNFINAATKTFLNVTDSQEAFASEFARMSQNLEQIYDRLNKAINDIMDSTLVSDENKQRYQEMVEQMTKTIMNPGNKKISFLTFKIVEETIKRACLRVQMDDYMPIEQDTVSEMRKILSDGRSSQHKVIDHSKSVVNKDGISGLNLLYGQGHGGIGSGKGSRKGSAASHRGLGMQQSVLTQSVLNSGHRMHEENHLNFMGTTRSGKSSQSRTRPGLPEQHSSESRSANTNKSRNPSESPEAQKYLDPSPVSKSTPQTHSISKKAMEGPVIAPTVMRPSVMGLPHESNVKSELNKKQSK